MTYSNLASRMRPQKLEDVVGQEHVTAPDKIIGRMVAAKHLSSMILYAPPGVGKTSMAFALSGSLGLPFEYFNASTDDKKKLRTIAEKAQKSENGLVMLLDEIHRLTKPLQDMLLPYLEEGSLIIVGATTENPYINIAPAIRSRAMILELHPVQPDNIVTVLNKALTTDTELSKLHIDVSQETLLWLAHNVNGDVRSALNALELASLSTPPNASQTIELTTAILSECIQRKQLSGDKNGDEHYNLLSAFQKSIRGSDVDASLHYLARLITSGDLVAICRRLAIIAHEDIGLANEQAVISTQLAIMTAQDVGFPEARIPLANAVVQLALSPKSNNAYKALDKALTDLELGYDLTIPSHLKDTHFKGADKLGHVGYQYPHDAQMHWLNQQYLPDSITDHFYLDTQNLTTPYEAELVNRAITIKQQQLDKGNAHV